MATREENINRTRQERQAALHKKFQGIVDRARERKKRTPQQQLERLDFMLGKDQGAKKERKRLLKLISN